jgi:hypothetical protein
MKNNMIIEVRQQDDFREGFAAYLAGSVKPKGRAAVLINVSNLMSIVAAKVVRPSDIPGIVADALFHEFLHAVEDWAGIAFSERRIHNLVEKYRKLYEKERAKTSYNKRKGGNLKKNKR